MEHEYLRFIDQMDQESLRQVMDAYGEDVWNYAYFISKRPELADDIAQDVFIRVYQKIGLFRGQCPFKSWLLAITRNTALNYVKSSFYRRVTLLDRIFPADVHPSAEKEYLDQELSHEVWGLVMKLSQKHREVLVLDAKYDLSVKEIAHVLGISEGTVKSRLSRARAKVNEAVKGEDHNGK